MSREEAIKLLKYAEDKYGGLQEYHIKTEEGFAFYNQVNELFQIIANVRKIIESDTADKSEDEFNKWWNSGYKHYSTFGGNEKTVACFAWNCQQKIIDRLEAENKALKRPMEASNEI